MRWATSCWLPWRSAWCAGARLAARSGARDLASRLGGDEFAVLLCGVSVPGEAVAVAERVLMELRQPFALGEREISPR